jgi:phosphoglycolate phosphatase
MKAPQLICYDFDGTLCNTLPDITASMNAVLERNGHKTVPEARIRDFIGSGIARLVERAVHYALSEGAGPPPAAAAVERITEEMGKYYREHLIERSHLYPGTESVLEHFSGIPQIIVSNKPEDMVRTMLEHFGIARHFDLVAGGDTLEVSKPHPRVWEYVKERMGLPEAPAGVMVGDSLPDVVFGRMAGLQTVAVSYGYNDVPSLREAGAHRIIDALEELKDAVQGEEVKKKA